MATMTLRLDDALLAELNMAAQAQGVPVSTFARNALAAYIAPDVDEGEDRGTFEIEVPQTLPVWQRHQTALLHRILARLIAAEDEALDKGDGAAHEQLERARVLEAGYTAEYEAVFGALSPEITPRESELVWDILDMFRVLRASYAHHGPSDALGAEIADALEFGGFDANDRFESRLLRFARHQIEDGKWEELAVFFDDEHDRGNSRVPQIGRYQRMLDVFRPIWKRKMRSMEFRLDPAEIAKVVKAAVAAK